MKILLLVCITIPTFAYGQMKDGVYKGYEIRYHNRRPNITKGEGHVNTAYVQGDSIFISKSPIAFKNHDTTFSVSDGGFYYYVGAIQQDYNSVILQLNNCDYCGLEVEKDSAGLNHPIVRKTRHSFKLTQNGFNIDGVHYGFSQALTPFNKAHFNPDINSIYKDEPIKHSAHTHK